MSLPHVSEFILIRWDVHVTEFLAVEVITNSYQQTQSWTSSLHVISSCPVTVILRPFGGRILYQLYLQNDYLCQTKWTTPSQLFTVLWYCLFIFRFPIVPVFWRSFALQSCIECDSSAFLHLKYNKTSLTQTTWDKDARLWIVQFRINQFFHCTFTCHVIGWSPHVMF